MSYFANSNFNICAKLKLKEEQQAWNDLGIMNTSTQLSPLRKTTKHEQAEARPRH